MGCSCPVSARADLSLGGARSWGDPVSGTSLLSTINGPFHGTRVLARDRRPEPQSAAAAALQLRTVVLGRGGHRWGDVPLRMAAVGRLCSQHPVPGCLGWKAPDLRCPSFRTTLSGRAGMAGDPRSLPCPPHRPAAAKNNPLEGERSRLPSALPTRPFPAFAPRLFINPFSPSSEILSPTLTTARKTQLWPVLGGENPAFAHFFAGPAEEAAAHPQTLAQLLPNIMLRLLPGEMFSGFSADAGVWEGVRRSGWGL